MSIFLEDLKAKALKATPGEWTLRDRGVICGGPVTEYFRGKGQPQIVMCCGGEQIGHEQKIANEHFIVAARPEVVLDLLERLDNSESERDALKAEVERLTPLQFRPAPCHAACEATAFNIEIRKQKAELEAARQECTFHGLDAQACIDYSKEVPCEFTWEAEAKRAFWAGLEIGAAFVSCQILPRWNEYIEKRKGELCTK
jgi:hypothetical protein